MVSEACLPSNAYYLLTSDYTLYSGVHVCCSEHSDSSFIYGFTSLDYSLGTMTATPNIEVSFKLIRFFIFYQFVWQSSMKCRKKIIYVYGQTGMFHRIFS